MLDDLENSIDVSHNSIADIANSTESTAEAIQKQAMMCSEIQSHTDTAEKEIHAMIEASHRTDDTVKESTQVVEELKAQAQSVEESSNIIVEVISSLTDKVNEVQNFSRIGRKGICSCCRGNTTAFGADTGGIIQYDGDHQ